MCNCLLTDHGVVRWHAHTEAECGWPPVREGDIWWHHGLRSEQSKGDRLRTAVLLAAGQKQLWHVSMCCGIVLVLLSFCRDSRWFWQRGGPLSTKRSTSPACTPAGQTHQVKKNKQLSTQIWYHALDMLDFLFFFFFSLAVQMSMPSFHEKMKSKLRTEAMGADTIVWLAVSAAAVKQPSGLFFQGWFKDQRQGLAPVHITDIVLNWSWFLRYLSCCLTFLPDRKAVATHLPLASSRSTPQEEEKLLTALQEFALRFKP